MKKILPIIIIFFFSNTVFAWTEGELDMLWMHCFAYEKNLSIGHKYEFCGCLPEQFLNSFDSQNDVASLANKGEEKYNNDYRIKNIYKTCDQRISSKKSFSGYSFENLDNFFGACIRGGFDNDLSLHSNLAYCGCLANELTKKIDFNKFQRIENSLISDQDPSSDILYLRNNLSKTCGNKVF